jgi:hypothetical protein
MAVQRARYIALETIARLSDDPPVRPLNASATPRYGTRPGHLALRHEPQRDGEPGTR